MSSRVITATILSVLALTGPPAAAAERPVRFGVQGSWSDDADFGLGVRAQIGLADFYEGLRGVASFDYFLPDDEGFGDVSYWEINTNLTYTLKGDLAPYVGGGFNIARASVSVVDETDVGLNVLGGLRLSDRLFGEAKFELGGGDMFVVTVGILF